MSVPVREVLLAVLALVLVAVGAVRVVTAADGDVHRMVSGLAYAALGLAITVAGSAGAFS